MCSCIYSDDLAARAHIIIATQANMQSSHITLVLLGALVAALARAAPTREVFLQDHNGLQINGKPSSTRADTSDLLAQLHDQQPQLQGSNGGGGGESQLDASDSTSDSYVSSILSLVPGLSQAAVVAEFVVTAYEMGLPHSSDLNEAFQDVVGELLSLFARVCAQHTGVPENMLNCTDAFLSNLRLYSNNNNLSKR